MLDKKANVLPANVTNELFLRTIYQEDYPRALVTGFPNQPTIDMPRHLWSCNEYRDGGQEKIANLSQNNYGVISTFNREPGQPARRRKSQHEATHLIMVDDVIAKVALKTLLEKFGLKPEDVTYRLETSPGNEQWGLALKYPEKRRWAVEQLLNGMVTLGLCPDGSDPGIKGVTRYYRLPVGTNNKQKYIEAIGCPFIQILHSWNPDNRFTVDGLAELFGIELKEPKPLEERLATIQRDDENDLVLQALIAEGLIISDDSHKPGMYHVRCLFCNHPEHGHTGGDPSGTAYFTPGATDGNTVYEYGGVCCNHGHGEQMTLKVWREELRRRGYDIPEPIKEDYIKMLDSCALDFPTPDMVKSGAVLNGDFISGKTEEISLEQTRELFNIGKELRTPAPPIKWVIDGLIPEDEVIALIATGGTGKSFLALQWAIAIATGGTACGIWNAPKPGGVLCFFGEENRKAFHRRTEAIIESQALIDGFEDDKKIDLDLTEKNLGVITLAGEIVKVTTKDNRDVTRTKYVDTIIKHGKNWEKLSGEPLKFIVIDPASRFRGGDENSADDVNAFCNVLEYIRGQFQGCCLLVLHHTNKAANSNGHSSGDDSRGSGAFKDAVRIQLNLRRMSKQEAKDYSIPKEEIKSYTEIEGTMANNIDEADSQWLYKVKGGRGVRTATTLTEEDQKMRKERNNEDLLERIIDRIVEEQAAGKRYSLTEFSRVFAGKTGEFGLGERPIQDLLKGAIDSGRIETEGTGRVRKMLINDNFKPVDQVKLDYFFGN